MKNIVGLEAVTWITYRTIRTRLFNDKNLNSFMHMQTCIMQFKNQEFPM